MSEYVNLSTIELESPASPSLTENMTTMTERLNRLEAEVQGIAGTNTYPKWWYEDEGTDAARAVKVQLQDPSIDPQHISDYFILHKKNQELLSVIRGYNDDTNPLSSVVYQVGATTVARGFKGEETDGPIHTALFDRLSIVNDIHDGMIDELEVLREAYDTGSLTGLLGIRGDEYADSLKPLLRTEHVIGLIRYVDQNLGSTDTLEERHAKTREWMGRALSAATGIDEAEADNYVFAASRTRDDKSIINILNKFDTFGVDRLRALSNFTGIHAFETYSDSQLERMERILNDSESAAEYLSRHDVTVVMINRFGDYNGILADAADAFEDGGKRTLVFEITRMSDILRHMLVLRDAHIKPSTLVVAAHSAPGQFFVSDLRERAHKRDDIATVAGRGLVRIVNNDGHLQEGAISYSMHEMKGVARMVEDFMQPSRAFDDAEEDAGRKKIIFQGCDMATETEAKDINANAERVTVGAESVVSRLGKDLVANDVTSNVDIYGAPASIQLHKTDKGVRFTKEPASLGDNRRPQNAVRIRLEKGVISTQQVDEIVLHG